MKDLIIIATLLALFWQTSAAQCYPDRHSTNWYDSWISCEAKESPNPEREDGHWIMFDYGAVYALGAAHIWNVNDPDRLSWGMQDVVIDVSVDGENWVVAGEFTFDIATGQSIYEGFEGPDFENIEARFLLITARTNFGGACFGLGEIQIEAEEVVTDVDDPSSQTCLSAQAFPNPFTDYLVVDLTADCKGEITVFVYDMYGRESYRSVINPTGTKTRMTIPADKLPPGPYIVKANTEGGTSEVKVVKSAN